MDSAAAASTEADLLARQIYLLCTVFLARSGPSRAVASLIEECEQRDLFPPTHSWTGERASSSFADAVRSCVARPLIARPFQRRQFEQSECGGLETLLCQLLDFDKKASGPVRSHIAPSTALLPLGAPPASRLAPVRFATDSKIDECRSPFTPLSRGRWETTMPWTLGTPWAECLLNLVPRRFLHVPAIARACSPLKLKSVLGHRSPAFCVLFDRSDRRVITVRPPSPCV